MLKKTQVQVKNHIFAKQKKINKIEVKIRDNFALVVLYRFALNKIVENNYRYR